VSLLTFGAILLKASFSGGSFFAMRDMILDAFAIEVLDNQHFFTSSSRKSDRLP
jgi:hypothetical protein